MRIGYYEHSTNLFPATCGEVMEWPNMGCASPAEMAEVAEHGLRITSEIDSVAEHGLRITRGDELSSRTGAAHHIGEVLEWPNTGCASPAEMS